MADPNKINAVILALLMFACGLMAQARFNVLSQSCGCGECKTRQEAKQDVKPEPNRPRPGPPS